MKKDTHTIFKNTGYQVIGKIVTSGLGLIGTILLSRYLGVEGFGQYSLIIAYVGFAYVIANFGLDALATRGLSNRSYDMSDLGHIATVRLILSFIAGVLAVGVSYLMPYNTTIRLGIGVFAAGYTFLMVSNTLWSYFRSKLAFRHIVFSEVLGTITSFGLILVGFYLKVSLLYYILAAVVGHIVTYILTLRIFNRSLKIGVTLAKAQEILVKSWPLALTAVISVVLTRIDLMMLSFYFRPDTYPDVGYYSLGYRITDVIIMFGGFYTRTLFPYFSRKTTQTNKNFRANMRISLLIAILESIGIFVLSKYVVLIAGGSSYLPTVPSLRILSWAAGLTIFSGFFTTYMVAYGYEKTWMKIAAIGLFANVFLNVLVIPEYSFIGASWTTLGTQVWILLGSMYIVRKIRYEVT